MSYCRWSSDNWRCDLYCYEDVSGGWTTHVARNRIDGDIPQVDWSLLRPGQSEEDGKKFMEQHGAQDKFLETCTRSPIDLPFDGQSFNDPDLESFLARVTMLRASGYNVPEYVFEAIKAEITEQAPPPTKERKQMIKPTIGRVVYFHPNGARLPTHLVFHGAAPARSDIVYVHSDSMVNLAITDHNGTTHPMTSVRLVQDDDIRPPEGQPYCAWMPFQVGQAKSDLPERVAHIEGTLEKVLGGDFKRYEAPDAQL